MQSEADDITVGDPPPHLMDEDLGSGQKWPQDSVALCVTQAGPLGQSAVRPVQGMEALVSAAGTSPGGCFCGAGRGSCLAGGHVSLLICLPNSHCAQVSGEPGGTFAADGVSRHLWAWNQHHVPSSL